MLEYIQLYKNGLHPDIKNFIYANDNEVSTTVVSIMNFPYEESRHFSSQEFIGGQGFQKQLFELDWEKFREIVYTKKDTELTRYSKLEEVKADSQIKSSLQYLKLKKIKKMIDENEADIEKTKNQEEIEMLQRTQVHLKNMEKKLQEISQTVMFR